MRRKSTSKPTIRDVAAYAGVSPTTVSHALSGKRPVSDEAQARIVEAMEVLGYEPSVLAQRLAGHPAQAIALIFPLVSGLFSSVENRYIPALGQPIAAAEYAFLVIYTSQMEMQQFQRFISSRVTDGVILMQVQDDDPRLELLETYDIPYVMIGRNAEPGDRPYVDQDFRAGIDEALQHLADFGHECVALLHYQDEQLGFVKRGKAAFLAGGEALGLTAYTAPTDLSDAAGHAAMCELLARDPAPTAAIVWNDLVVVGAERALAEHRLRIPDDFLLICYDRSPSFSLTAGPLTIIDTHIDEIGNKAATLLLALLSGKTPQETQILIPSALVPGKSTGPRA